MTFSANSQRIKNLFTEALATIYAAKYCILIAFMIYICASTTGWLYSENFPFFKETVRKITEGFIAKNAFTFIGGVLLTGWGYRLAASIAFDGIFLLQQTTWDD
jgi:hypothetical protein